MSSKYSCTPGYTCRSLCILKDFAELMKRNKQAYTSNWARIEKQISPKQKERMDFSSIVVHVATCAYKKFVVAVIVFRNLLKNTRLIMWQK